MKVRMEQITVVIVDDHAMLRQGLAAFLMSYDDLKLVGEAANGKEGLVLCADKQPDIVLMDLMMPIMDGITATHLIRHDFPDIQVIALTSFGEEKLIKDVLEAGAISYLFKKISADDLAKAIRAAQNGVSTFAQEVTEILVRSVRQPHPVFEDLTPREREVLAWLASGKTDREIAEILGRSVRTVHKHLEHLYAKLGVETRTAAVLRASTLARSAGA